MRGLLLCICALMLPLMATAQGVRLKDLAYFEGVRGNDLVGYGLVVGLDGSGDSPVSIRTGLPHVIERSSPSTPRTMPGGYGEDGYGRKGALQPCRNILKNSDLPTFHLLFCARRTSANPLT